MAKQKDTRNVTDIVAFQATSTVTALPPDSGVVGQFLDETRNMLKARAMRMSGLLRQAAARMEAAESSLTAQFQNEGLLPDGEGNEEMEG